MTLGRYETDDCNEPLYPSCDDCGFAGCDSGCLEEGFHESTSSRGNCRKNKKRNSSSYDHRDPDSCDREVEVHSVNASVPGVKTPIIATSTSSLAPLFKKSKSVSKSTKVVKESGARNTSDDADDAVTIKQRIDDFVPPKGYKRFNKIKIAGVQSIMYQCGEKVVSINNLDPPLWYWKKRDFRSSRKYLQ
jgi:hypothetical protein